MPIGWNGAVLRIALALLVLAVATAAGVNLIRTAPQATETEQWLFGHGRRARKVRLWTIRIGGVVLLVVGLTVLGSAFAPAP
jgi:membrane protein YqaA with SNARE-associated domain